MGTPLLIPALGGGASGPDSDFFKENLDKHFMSAVATRWGSSPQTHGCGVTSRGTGTYEYLSTGIWEKRTTGAVAGNDAGWVIGPGIEARMEPEFDFVVEIPSGQNNYRIWIGLEDSTPSNIWSGGLDHLTANKAVLRLDSATDGGIWQAITGNGAANTAVPLGAATFDQLITGKIKVNPASVEFTIGGQSTEIATTLPGAAVTRGIVILIFTTDAVAKAIRIKRCNAFSL
jgi:hypothetical protein